MKTWQICLSAIQYFAAENVLVGQYYILYTHTIRLAESLVDDNSSDEGVQIREMPEYTHFKEMPEQFSNSFRISNG